MTQPSFRRTGVCSWSLRPRNPRDLVAALERLNIKAVQLALSPVVRETNVWQDAFAALRDAGIDILSGMMAMAGEDYATLESIARTGGVRPDATWPANLEHARQVATLAAREHIRLVTFHAGFIPHDAADPDRARLLDRLAQLADLFHAHSISIAFETGQETAATLLGALNDLARPNVGVNFDPANMILYGMGDPIDALRMLAPRIMQIHVKDAMPAQQPGTWGSEVVAGSGAVEWPCFFEIASQIKPRVNFVIERESGGAGGQPRESDIAAARDLIASFISA